MVTNTSNKNHIVNNSVLDNNVNSLGTSSNNEEHHQQRINYLSTEFRDPRGLNLFVEATEAAVMSIAAFAVANMRTLAYRGLLSEEDAKDVMELPMTGKRFGELYLKHNDLIKTIRSSDFIDLANKHVNRTNRIASSEIIHYVGDENQEADCVHVIHRDDIREIIYLTFRGSVSLRDWRQDLKLVLVEEPNPLYCPPPSSEEEISAPKEGPTEKNIEEKVQQPELIGIHWGFNDYLFGKAKNPFLKAAAKLVALPGNNSIKSDTKQGRASHASEISSSSDTNNKGQSTIPLLSTEFEVIAALSPAIVKEERTSTSTSNGQSSSIMSTKNEVKAAISTVEEERSSTAASTTKTTAAATKDGGNVYGSTATTTSNASSASTSSSTSTRIQVLLQQLRTLKEKYPSDRIFIAGHSLGGALGLIAAIWIGADPILNKLPENTRPGFTPINVFTIGNPKPGNKAFCEAIYHLEKSRKLRCCVVHNTRDPIPLLPVNVIGRKKASFFHPGFRVLMYANRFELGRSLALRPAITSWSKSIQEDVILKKCCWDGPIRRRRRQRMEKQQQQEAENQSRWEKMVEKVPIEAVKALKEEKLDTHTYREYLARMLSQEEHLAEVYINELYDTFCGQEQTNTSNMINNGDSP